MMEALRSKMRRMRSLFRFHRKALRFAFMLEDVMGGRFFEEWKEGEEFVTPSRTVTETGLVMFAALSGDYNELHTSEEFMKGSRFGRRIGHGLLVSALSHGLLFRTGFLETTVIALMGVDSWKFLSPF